MINIALTYLFRFLLFTALQILIFNKIEIGLGIQIMPYPLFVFLLPINLKIGYSFIIAFVMGICIDMFSNTYGLHTSSLLLFTYLKPWIIAKYSSREEDKDMIYTNIYSRGFTWYAITFGLLILIHHTWFFLLESFRWDLFIFILFKLILSVLASFILSIIMQYLFVAKPLER